MAASPSFSINGNPVNTKASVAASATVVATLDSTEGVNSVLWIISRTDETSQPSDYTVIISGSKGEIATVTSLGVGTVAVFLATINGGKSEQNDQPSDTSRQEVKFFVPDATIEMLAAGELDSSAARPDRLSSATHGPVDPVNAALRVVAAGGGGGGGGVADFDHVETIVVGANVQSVTFSSLLSDTDEGYKIEFYWIADTAAVLEMQLNPNGVAAGGADYAHRVGHAAGLTTTPVTDFEAYGFNSFCIAETHGFSSGGQVNGTIWMPAWKESGEPRIWRCSYVGERTVVAIVRAAISARHNVYWNNSATEITSIELDSGSANGIKTGSRFMLSKGKWS